MLNGRTIAWPLTSEVFVPADAIPDTALAAAAAGRSAFPLGAAGSSAQPSYYGGSDGADGVGAAAAPTPLAASAGAKKIEIRMLAGSLPAAAPPPFASTAYGTAGYHGSGPTQRCAAAAPY